VPLGRFCDFGARLQKLQIYTFRRMLRNPDLGRLIALLGLQGATKKWTPKVFRRFLSNRWRF